MSQKEKIALALLEKLIESGSCVCFNRTSGEEAGKTIAEAFNAIVANLNLSQ